jgi:hypothetical protein
VSSELEKATAEWRQSQKELEAAKYWLSRKPSMYYEKEREVIAAYEKVETIKQDLNKACLISSVPE